jgi:hypothetical protein
MFKRALDTIIFIAALSACGTAFATPSIPAQFHGVWTTPSECKTYKESGISDTGIEVTPVAIQQYETGCSLGRIIHADATSFTGEFSCSVEGNTSRATIRLSLSNGTLRYNNSAALSRCN